METCERCKTIDCRETEFKEVNAHLKTAYCDYRDLNRNYLEQQIETLKLQEQLRVAVEGLKRGCSCRPGGGTCACCLALQKLKGGA